MSVKIDIADMLQCRYQNRANEIVIFSVFLSIGLITCVELMCIQLVAALQIHII